MNQNAARLFAATLACVVSIRSSIRQSSGARLIELALALAVLPVLGRAGELPAVTGLTLSVHTRVCEKWVQTAMRDGDSHLYAFSCNIGYTNWSFVGGDTTEMVPLYSDPEGNVIRDPGHICYHGRYYLVYNCESFHLGVAVSADDIHWTYAGGATIGYTNVPYWSPKFFLDASNALWCNVRFSTNLPPGTYPYQQFCFRFDTGNPTNTVNREGHFICTNIWNEDNSDFPTAQLVYNHGLYYLFNQGGNIYCSPTLTDTNWTQIGNNVFGQTMDGPCLAKYGGVWYITDSQNGSVNWFASTDLTHWTLSTQAGWTDYGFKEGTAIIQTTTVQTTTLAWQPNYTAAGQASVVVAADDLTVPRNQWQIVFTGSTNQFTLTNDRPARYFSVYNLATNHPAPP